MTSLPKPAAEHPVDVDLVRALLAAQRPDLADLPLRVVAEGWDNVLVRVGDELVARLPRRRIAADLVAHEQRWLPVLAPDLPLPVPAPVHRGRPTAEYPWPWSVLPWVPGRSALEDPSFDAGRMAEDLGRFLAALHRPAPEDAPPNPYRGIPLADRSERDEANLASVDGLVDGTSLRRLLAELVAVPGWDRPPVWIHGDLHPGNLVVDDGRLAAVIDFGDITSGDPATDLAVAWALLPTEDRPRLRATAGAASGGIDDDTWARARGWALALGLAYLAHSADAPAYGALGRRTLAAVLADGSS